MKSFLQSAALVAMTASLALFTQCGSGDSVNAESSSPPVVLASTPPDPKETLELQATIKALREELQAKEAQKVPVEVEALGRKVRWFAEKGWVLQKGGSNMDSIFREQRSLASDELVELQSKLFPKMRRAYVKQLRSGNEIEVVQQDKEITFRSTSFADPQTQGQFKVAHEKSLKALRFQRLHFRWGDGADQVRSFDTYAMADEQPSDRISGGESVAD